MAGPGNGQEFVSAERLHEDEPIFSMGLRRLASGQVRMGGAVACHPDNRLVHWESWRAQGERRQRAAVGRVSHSTALRAKLDAARPWEVVRARRDKDMRLLRGSEREM
jgi:hypothetical protein